MTNDMIFEQVQENLEVVVEVFHAVLSEAPAATLDQACKRLKATIPCFMGPVKNIKNGLLFASDSGHFMIQIGGTEGAMAVTGRACELESEAP